jgi:hypothetical protein
MSTDSDVVLPEVESRRWQRMAGTVAVLAAAFLVLTPVRAHAAPSITPVGSPYEIVFNHAAQVAVVAGTTAAASGAVCYTAPGVGCAVSGVVSAVTTAYVSDAVVCPDSGFRHVRMQNYQVPPGSPTGGVQTKILGSDCRPT